MYVNVYIILKHRFWLPMNFLGFITVVQIFEPVNEPQDCGAEGFQISVIFLKTVTMLLVEGKAFPLI